MGAINIKHTGSGSDIALSSDGTSLLLDGTAIGGGGGASDYTRATKTANYTVVAGDLGKIIDVTSNSVTISLTAAATLGDGFYVYIRNSSSTATDVVTIDGNGSETIDGSPLIYLRRYEGIQLVCDGSGFFSLRPRIDGLQTNLSQQSHQLDQPRASGSQAIALGGQTDATANFATAIGYQSEAAADSSLALGRGAGAHGDYSTSIGYNTTATGQSSLAIGGQGGYNTRASGSNSVAIGSYSKSEGSGSFTGPYSYASGNYSVSMGISNGSTSYGATGAHSVSIGQLAKATAANSIAIGDTATSTVANLIALGGTTDTVKISGAYTLPQADGNANEVLTTNGSGVLSFAAAGGGGGADLYAANESSPTAQPSATGANAVAIGDQAIASGPDSFAIGEHSDATGTRTHAFGFAAVATHTNALAFGTSRAFAADATAISIANNSTSYGASGANSVAMGYQAKATASGSMAFGDRNTASGEDAVVFGENNTGSGAFSFTAGRSNTNSGSRGVALGNAHTVSDFYTFASGSENTASEDYAHAVGSKALADRQGKFAHGSLGFGTVGDSQYGRMILSKATTDATATVLTALQGNSAASANMPVIPSGGAQAFSGLVVAKQTSSANAAAWEIKGLIVNNGGTTTLVNSAITVIDNTPSWGGPAITADNTNNWLAITCTGAASTSIRWSCTLNTSELIYA